MAVKDHVQAENEVAAYDAYSDHLVFHINHWENEVKDRALIIDYQTEIPFHCCLQIEDRLQGCETTVSFPPYSTMVLLLGDGERLWAVKQDRVAHWILQHFYVKWYCNVVLNDQSL